MQLSIWRSNSFELWTYSLVPNSRRRDSTVGWAAYVEFWANFWLFDHNSARFRTTLEFHHEYFRKGSRYQKSEKVSYQLRSLPRTTKKLMNVGLLATKFGCLISTHPESTARASSDNFGLPIANICGTEQAIDKQRTTLSTAIYPTVDGKMADKEKSLVVSCLHDQNQHWAFSVGYCDCVRHVALLGAEFHPPP